MSTLPPESAGSSPHETSEAGSANENPLLLRISKQLREWEHFWKDTFAHVRQSRRYLWNKFLSDETGREEKTIVNLADSTVQRMVPYVYARDPEISIRPQDGFDIEQPYLKDFSRNICQPAVNRMLKEADLKSVCKAATRGALSSDIAYIKFVWRESHRYDPMTQARIDDTSYALAKLDALIRRIKSDEMRGNPEQLEAERQELQHMVRSIQASGEVTVIKRLVLQRILAEHLIVDPSIQQIENFHHARGMCHINWMPLTEAEAKYGMEFKHVHTYTMETQLEHDYDEPGVYQRSVQDSGKEDRLLKVLEWWDQGTHTVYTWADGDRDWATEPYNPTTSPRRWFPFVPLAFHPVDGRFWPNGLVEKIKPLQNDYNNSREQENTIREASKPRGTADKATAKDTLENWKTTQGYDIVLVDANERPVEDVIKWEPPPHFNPALFDRAPIRSDLELVSGMQDATRGSLTRAKTATEASIMQGALQSANTEYRDIVEGVVETIANWTLDIMLIEMSPPEAARYIGQRALTSWPQSSEQDVLEMLSLEIRAGTTGNPDLPLEREAFAQAIPIILQLQDRIMMFQQQGIDPAPAVALMRRFIASLDTPMDLEELIPGGQQQGFQGGGMGVLGPEFMMAAGGGQMTPQMPSVPGTGADIIPFPPAAQMR